MSYVQSGVLFIESGDVSSGTVLDGQYAVDLLSGLPLGSGLWAAIVDSGGTLVGGDIINFGVVGVNTGGVAIDTVVSSGLLGVLGVASDTLDYDTVEVAGGGVVIGTTVAAASDRPFGGELLVYSSGAASATTVLGGGAFSLWDNSVASNTTVIGGYFGVGGGGSEEVIGSGGVAGSVTVLSGGTLALNGTAAFTIASGGTLAIGPGNYVAAGII